MGFYGKLWAGLNFHNLNNNKYFKNTLFTKINKNLKRIK